MKSLIRPYPGTHFPPNILCLTLLNKSKPLGSALFYPKLKTMLKRKLHKAGIVTTSFVLLAISSGSKPYSYNGDRTNDGSKHNHRTPFHLSHSFDSTGLCICVPTFAMELDDAPRIKLNKQGEKFVRDHVKRNTLSFEKIRETKASRFTLIDSLFTLHGLPVELKYLAVIESKLNTTAVSRVGAKGMWQFMPATARRFGLKIKGKYDERLYAYKSTVAAAKYLTYLYKLFDDWLLTIAAYNSGPGYVYAAIKKSGSRDFWKLQHFLPLETRNHVKKYFGTHYLYEGHGGLTTLTKAETLAHISSVTAWVEKNQKDIELAKATDTLSIETVAVQVSQE